MRTKLFSIVAGAAIIAATAAVPAVAHHSFAAEFDAKKPVKLRGTVKKMEWINPHSWIHIEVTRPDGGTEVWMVEGGTPNTLLRQGLRRECLAIGTELIVDGYQAKDHSLKRANGRDVTLTDGRKFFMGSSGTGAPDDGAEQRARGNDSEC